MPTYSIEGPDGKTYTIDGPEGATREQVINAIKAREPSLNNQTDSSVTPKVENEPDTHEGFLTEVAEGAAAGVLNIGEGIIELGLTAGDLAFNTNNAREFNKKVDAWKDSVGLDPEGLAGTLTEGIVQFAIPGLGAASAVSKLSKIGKLGTKIAKSKRGRVGGLGQPVQRKLTTSQKVALGAQQMAAAGVADAIVTTDGTQTIGDFFDGGPTRTDVYNVGDTGTEDAARRLNNRLSMFIEGGVLAGALPPVLSAVGSGVTKVGAPVVSPVAKKVTATVDKLGKKIKAVEDRVRDPNVTDVSSFENFLAQTTTLFKNRGFMGDPVKVKMAGVKAVKGKEGSPEQFGFTDFNDEVKAFNTFGEAQNEYIKMIDEFTYDSDEYLELAKKLKKTTDEEELAKITDDMEELVNLNRNVVLENGPVVGLNNAKAATPDKPGEPAYEETIDLFKEFTIADPTTEAAFKVARAKFQMAEAKFTKLIKKPEYADLSKYSKEKLFNTIGEYLRGNIKVNVAGKNKSEIKATMNELGIPPELLKPIRDMVKIKNNLTEDVLKSKAIANLPTISQIKASLPKSVKATGMTEDDWLILQKKRGITPQEEIRKAIEDSIIKGDGSNNSGFLVTRYEILENSKYELTESKINETLSMLGFAKGGRTVQTFDEKTTQRMYRHVSRLLDEKRALDGVDDRIKAAESKGLAPDQKDLELQRKLTYKADSNDELGDAYFTKGPTEQQARTYIDLAFNNMKAKGDARLRGLGNTYRAPILKIPTTLFNAKQINIPTLKAIYGEIKDGKEGFISTITQMAQFNAVDNFYSQMRKIVDFDIAKNGKNSIYKNTNDMSPSEFAQYLKEPASKQSYIMGRSGSRVGELSDIDVSESPFGAMHGIAVPANMWKSMSNIVVNDQNTAGKIARAIYTGFLRLKGASQYAKTILSPITQIRNITSAALFAAAQGNVGRGANVMESLRLVTTDVLGRYDSSITGYNKRAFANQKESVLEYLTDLQNRGIIGSSASLREIQDNLRKGTGFGYERGRSISESEANIRLDEDSPEKLNRQNSSRYGGTVDPEILKKVTEENMSGLIGKIKAGATFFEDTYKGGDDIWKIYNYEFELNKLRTARSKYLGRAKDAAEAKQFKKEFDDIFLNGSTIEDLAGDRVRNLVPNYDLSSQLVKSLRKLPVGNFISFPAEIIRTGFNTLDTAMRELSSSIPEIREIGMRRLMGSMGTMIALPLTIRELAMSLTGTSDEEMAAIQNMSASFQKNSTLIPVGRNEKGHMEVIDFSHTNPYDMIIRPMTGVLRSLDESGRLNKDGIDSAREAAFEGFTEFFQPFFDESIITSRFLDVAPKGFPGGRQGETESGAKVYKTGEGGDTFGDQFGKSFIHILEGLTPGASPFRVPTGASLEQIELGRFMRGVTKPGSKEPSTGKEFSTSAELLRAVTGVNTQSYDWDRLGGFKAQEFKSNRSVAATLFNSVNRRAVVSEDEFLDAWDKANAARLRVFRKQRANMLDLQRLGATQKEVIERMKKEGVGDNEIGAMLKNKFIPFFPSTNTFKIAKEKGHMIPLEKIKEKYRSFLGTSLDPVEETDEVSEVETQDPVQTSEPVVTNTPTTPVVKTSQTSPVARDINTRLATLLNPNDRIIAERQRNIG